MRIDSIQIREGSKIVNLTVDSGSSFPGTPNAGELFYRTDNETLYFYNGTAWTSAGGGGSSAFTISGDVSGTIDGGTDELTLATVNSNVGSFGSASAVSTFTVNAKGLLTAAGSTSIGIAANQVTSGTFADARIAASNVTQHQAALTILESQINDGALLARVGGTETITGVWTFNNPIVGSTSLNVLKAGDTMTGNLSISTGTAVLSVDSTTANAQARLDFKQSGLIRWVIGKDTNVESGSNVGSDFNIRRFNDAGSQIDIPLTITRSTGQMSVLYDTTFGQNVIVSTAPTLGNHLTNKTYVDAQVVSASSGLSVVQVAGTTQSAVSGVHYIMTNTGATSTLTLPATPTVGNTIWVSNHTGRIDLVVARNGSNIMALAEDFIVNVDKANVQLRFVDSTRGWVLV